MNFPTLLSFEYDYAKECWTLPRGSVPTQLKSQGVTQELWARFFDYAQSVVERASVRSIMKTKLDAECRNYRLTSQHTHSTTRHSLYLASQKRQIEDREREMRKLEEQTSRDFVCLQREAERVFRSSKATIQHDANQNGRPCGLAIQLDGPTKDQMKLHLQYDKRRASWNLPRDRLPAPLVEIGVVLADWIAIWDYGLGVNQRAHERKHLNELHDRQLKLFQKSLNHMQANHSINADYENNSASTATQIGLKMDKLRRAMEANTKNTQKGWHELQRRATLRFEPYGIRVSLSHPDEDSHVGCGLKFHASDVPAITSNSSPTSSFARAGRQSPPHSRHHQGPEKTPISSSIWLHHKVKDSQEASPTIPSVWNYSKETQLRMSSHQPAFLTTSPSNRSSSSSDNVLRARENTPDESKAPPKPETTYHPKTSSSNKNKWEPGTLSPVVLTYVHDEVPSKIEVTTRLSFEDPSSSFDEEDSHGYVVPPAPIDPPSSIGNSSSSNFKEQGAAKKKKIIKCVRFGPNKIIEFENPYTKIEKEKLWFSSKERDANRAKTKLLAQRVIDSQAKDGQTVVLMDSDTGEAVYWRGLEHARKGNLSWRQDTRRTFMTKILEKQRALRLDAFSRRGSSSKDPAVALQQYASRHSRSCQSQAQKFAANDAKEARTVYKESLQTANFYRDSCESVDSRSRSLQHSQGSESHKKLQQHKTHQHENDIFQDYCRQMHLASKSRMQPAAA